MGVKTKMNDQVTEMATSYLKQPYARLIVPETDGTFRGEILEFPGCIATGDTPAETLSALEEAAADWLEAALAHGQHVPDPVDSNEFSGRLALRLPKSLHKKAARVAEREGVSLNQFIVASLAECVGERARSSNTLVVSTVASISRGAFHFLQNTAGQFINAPSLSIGLVPLTAAPTTSSLVQTG